MWKFSETIIAAATLDWLRDKSPERSIALTVTFCRTGNEQLISQQAIEDTVRVLCRKLNTKAFGNSFRNGERRLAIIPVYEGGTAAGDKHPHCHFLIEAPEGWTTESWMRAVKDLVLGMRWLSSTQYDIQEVRDEGWLEYILKRRDKRVFADSIDFLNLWVNG